MGVVHAGVDDADDVRCRTGRAIPCRRRVDVRHAPGVQEQWVVRHERRLQHVVRLQIENVGMSLQRVTSSCTSRDDDRILCHPWLPTGRSSMASASAWSRVSATPGRTRTRISRATGGVPDSPRSRQRCVCRLRANDCGLQCPQRGCEHHESGGQSKFHSWVGPENRVTPTATRTLARQNTNHISTVSKNLQIAVVWPKPRVTRVSQSRQNPDRYPDFSDGLAYLTVKDRHRRRRIAGVPLNPLAHMHEFYSGLDPLERCGSSHA